MVRRAPKRGNGIDSIWDFLWRLGIGPFLLIVALYLIIGVVLFVYSSVKNVDFEYPPGIRVGAAGHSPAADTTAIDIGRDIVSQVIGARKDGSLIAESLQDHREAARRNSELFLKARESIKIVTVHGGSWIRSIELQEDFIAAVERVDKVELLVVDPAGTAFDALSSSRIRGLEREFGYQRLSKETFKDAFDFYRSMIQQPKFKGKLSLYYYTAYPWIRFSIYDNMHSTFVIVPFLKPGVDANVYYTDDAWAIECLDRIFESFKAQSRLISSKDEYDVLWR